jgi:hypothetical protein
MTPIFVVIRLITMYGFEGIDLSESFFLTCFFLSIEPLVHTLSVEICIHHKLRHTHSVIGRTHPILHCESYSTSVFRIRLCEKEL